MSVTEQIPIEMTPEQSVVVAVVGIIGTHGGRISRNLLIKALRSRGERNATVEKWIRFSAASGYIQGVGGHYTVSAKGREQILDRIELLKAARAKEVGFSVAAGRS